jgi:ABC-type transporter Mla subunit MlaD
MKDKAKRFWIGVFVLTSLVMLGSLIILFGTAPTLFKRTTHYVIIFPEAPNVGPGTPVRKAGVRIGEVQEVALDDEKGEVRVTVAIESQFTIRQSDQARLTTGLLGSDAAIDFVPQAPPEPGQPPLDRSPLPSGSVIVGVRGATVNSLIGQVADVVPPTRDAVEELRKSLQRIEKLMPVADETMKEIRDLARDVRKSVPGLNQTSDEIRELSKEIRQAMPDARETLKELRKAMPEATETMKELRKAMPEATEALKEIRQLAKSTREAIPEARATIGDIGAAARVYTKLGERLNVLLESNQDKIVKVIDNLNETFSRAADLLNEENRANVRGILSNVREGSKDFPEMSRNFLYISREGRTSVNLLNDSLKRVDDTLKDIQGNTNKTLGQRVNTILVNLDEASDKANRTFTDVRELVRVIGQADGTFNRILTDPSLYNHVDEVVCMIGKVVPRLDRILKDVETFADKLARHPESLGIGGALRPSSGLKDPPTPSYYPPGPPH